MKRILAVMACAVSGCIYADVKTPLAYRAPTAVEANAAGAADVEGTAVQPGGARARGWGDGGYAAAVANAKARSGATDWPMSAPTPPSSTSSPLRQGVHPRHREGHPVKALLFCGLLLWMRGIHDSLARGSDLSRKARPAECALIPDRRRAKSTASPAATRSACALPVGRMGPGRLGRRRLPRCRRQSAAQAPVERSPTSARRAVRQRPRLAAGMPGGDRGGQIGALGGVRDPRAP